MTKDEWMELARNTKRLFENGNLKFLSTRSEAEAWYEFVQDMNIKQATIAMKECINSSPYPPTIAELREKYRGLSERTKNFQKRIYEIYNGMVTYYPMVLRDEGAKETFAEVIKANTESECLEKAMSIHNKVIECVKEVERGKDDVLPNLSDCIRRCANDNRRTTYR